MDYEGVNHVAFSPCVQWDCMLGTKSWLKPTLISNLCCLTFYARPRCGSLQWRYWANDGLQARTLLEAVLEICQPCFSVGESGNNKKDCSPILWDRHSIWAQTKTQTQQGQIKLKCFKNQRLDFLELLFTLCIYLFNLFEYLAFLMFESCIEVQFNSI